MKFFCAKCRAERETEEFEEFKTKHNIKMARAKCPICGLEVYKKLEEPSICEK